MRERVYVGRFAPSPTGPLHMGSLVAAMASYLDAKAQGGKWLVRIEDIDKPRTIPGAARHILDTLEALGMRWDDDVVFQSQREPLYENALNLLSTHVYACGCSRQEIADSRLGTARDGSAIYPGTCRNGLPAGRSARAIRLRVPAPGAPDECIRFEDRWQGQVTQRLALEAGDFVLKRADGFWAYQLAVVVDDAEQGITHVVRGVDLLDSTPRQIYLQKLLGMPTPLYMHVPVVTNAAGEKLSKQTGATSLDLNRSLETLVEAAGFLGLPITMPVSVEDFWEKATRSWKLRFAIS